MKSQEEVCPLRQTFFGLNSDQIPEFRVQIFKQIHQIVFHGQGGYSWTEVYNMPIWLRKFTFSELQSHYKEKNKPPENLNSKTLVDKDVNVNTPAFAQTSAQYKRKTSYK